MDWLSLETPMVGTESIIYSNILRFYLVARWYETFIFVSYVHKSNMQDLLVATINFTGMFNDTKIYIAQTKHSN